MKVNAWFYVFKPSGKFYTSDRGVLPQEAFGPNCHSSQERRVAILKANGGKMPGLRTNGDEFQVTVVADEDCDLVNSFPLHLNLIPSDD